MLREWCFWEGDRMWDKLRFEEVGFAGRLEWIREVKVVEFEAAFDGKW